MIEKRFSNIYPQPWAQMFVLLGFCFFLYFMNLGRWDLWSPDEPRYAQVAREMVNGGDWILMHFNGRVYEDKPPLFFWFIAFSSYLWQGFNSFSVRFPAALFGTFTVLLTFLLGKNIYSTRTGFFSGFILATSLEFAYLSTRANMDGTLTFFTTASLLCFFQWYRNPSPHLGSESKPPSPVSRREREEVKVNWFEQKKIRNLSIYGFYIGMALGTLTKGPVGFILPLFVGVIYLLIQRDWKGIKGMKLIPGIVLMMLIILAWYIPAVWKGGREYLNATLLKHTISRYSEGWSHVKPFYYYFYNYPLESLPWFLFLPAAMAYGFSKETMERKRNFLFLLTWFVVIFIFFSLSKGKRGLYLLPVYPAVSIMIGKLWNDFISASIDHFRHEWVSIPLYGLMGLTLVAGAAVSWLISIKFPSYLPESLPIAFLMLGGGLTLFVLNRFRMQGAIFFLLVGMMAGGFFYTLRVVFPLVNPYKSARYVCQEITSRIQHGEKLALYGGFVTAPYNFYTGIVPMVELEGEENLVHFLKSPERVFCILKFRDFSKFQAGADKPRVQLITRRRVGDDDIVLISNR